jgi:hypothetical protein
MADSVRRLMVAVEGPTEDNFVRQILHPHLWSHGIAVSSTIVGKAKAAARGNSGKGSRGGGCYADWERDIHNCLKDNPSRDFRLTTLFDLYGLPGDFPGRDRIASDRSQADRCDRLQRILACQINDWRFIPYLQLHEFEALVMACLPDLEALYDAPDQLAGLARLRAEVASLKPEEINDSKVTAPSKRLERLVPGYRKQQDGPDAIELAGLPSVRLQCPRFGAWLTQLELLGDEDPHPGQADWI